MGIGCFLWVPLSIGLGRRPTILIATVLVFLAMIWAGHARSFLSLVGAVSILGLGEGLSLSLVCPPALLNDISLTALDLTDDHRHHIYQPKAQSSRTYVVHSRLLWHIRCGVGTSHN